MALKVIAASALADHVYRNTNFSSPQTWLGLHRSDESELSSVDQPGYGRVRLDAVMGQAVNGTCTSVLQLNFPPSTQPWGTVTSVGIWTTQTGGNLLQVVQLPQPISISSNVSVSFAAGTIVLGFGNVIDGYWQNGSKTQVPDGYWLEDSNSGLPSGYYEQGVLQPNEPDGYWEDGERSQIPDGCYEDGELVPPSATATSWGWQNDLTEEQWAEHLAVAQWVGLNGCTAEQAATVFYVDNGQLRYDASRAIAAGANIDFSFRLRLAPRIHFSLEGRFFSQRNLVDPGGFLDLRVPYLVDDVMTVWPSTPGSPISTNELIMRVPASLLTLVSSSPPAPGAGAFIRGVINSGFNINNYGVYVNYRITVPKWPPPAPSYVSNIIAKVSTSENYATGAGGSAPSGDSRVETEFPGPELADNSRASLDFVMGSTAAGVTNTASGWIHTLYFMSKQIEL